MNDTRSLTRKGSSQPDPIGVLEPTKLDPESLCKRCSPLSFDFQSTNELDELPEMIGQTRAANAVRFGISMKSDGYNLFVLGPSGIGKRTFVSRFLEAEAATRPMPSDWCYVNNFDEPHKPVALKLPAGIGRRLRQDMRQLVDELGHAIPAIFESDEYRARHEQLEGEFNERQGAAFSSLGAKAQKKGVALLRTPAGFGLAPMRNGEVIGPEEYEQLPPEEKQRLVTELAALNAELQKLIRQLPQWGKEKRDRVKQLNREFTMLAVAHLVDELKERYADLPLVLNFIEQVRQDVIENAHRFRASEEDSGSVMAALQDKTQLLRRYEVNLLVDSADTNGAPIVFLDHPTYASLMGRVEHMEHLGALITDFTLIKAGALHKANGGYLMLDVRKVLLQPYAWEALKRALESREGRFDSLGHMLGLVSTVSLEPQPIPLDVKVVLFGDRILFYLLLEFDPDFAELFKVAADFEDTIDRNDDNNRLYARLVATIAKREGTLAFDRGAVARLIERSARLAGDAEKLTTHVQTLVDLMRESDYLARAESSNMVSDVHVQRAVDAQIRRVGRIRERVQEAILRGTILIETGEARLGQINGLSLFDLGNFTFAQPTRITATVRVGDGEVVDIQREVKLGGAIHSKGVLILSSFLAMRYSGNMPLSLSASLVFEQTYGAVEGDSASLAELCALLSALAGAPIKQSLAVTGSVDQCGQIQAIGAVNDKIEGFFDICTARGLTGEQGVLVPAANVKHLMLRDEVVNAVGQGQFHVYCVQTVDQAMEILTGIPAGEPHAEGAMREENINSRVAARLTAFSAIRRSFAAGVRGKESES